jgi:signal transduction histidine kinase
MDLLIPIIIMISIFLIPATGLMMILVSRFALKPLVETLSRALRESRQPDAASLAQIHELTERLYDLTEEVRRLQEARDFDRELLEGAEVGEREQATS